MNHPLSTNQQANNNNFLLLSEKILIEINISNELTLKKN